MLVIWYMVHGVNSIIQKVSKNLLSEQEGTKTNSCKIFPNGASGGRGTAWHVHTVFAVQNLEQRHLVFTRLLLWLLWGKENKSSLCGWIINCGYFSAAAWFPKLVGVLMINRNTLVVKLPWKLAVSCWIGNSFFHPSLHPASDPLIYSFSLSSVQSVSQQSMLRIVCCVVNTLQTINKALIHRLKIISCSQKPIGYINTSIKALGYELNITQPRREWKR